MAATKKKTTPKKAPPTMWETLSKVDCSEHIEKKGGFNYLSWAWAWGILMEHYPEATFENHLNQDGYPCFFDKDGNAMVRVTLCIEGKCHSEDFPVLNYKNQAIKNPDSFSVNTALKRGLVKCMAYYGLGHYIYAGEDLPKQDEEEAKEVQETKAGFDRLNAMKLIKSHQDVKTAFDNDGENGKPSWTDKILNHFDVKSLEELSDGQIERIVERITKEKK